MVALEHDPCQRDVLPPSDQRAGVAWRLVRSAPLVALLALPHALLRLGAAAGLAAFAATAALSYASCACLAAAAVASRTPVRQLTYRGTLAAALGRWAARAHDATAAVGSIGARCMGMHRLQPVVG